MTNGTPSVSPPVSVSPSEHAVLLPNGQPDWEAITFEVLCSRCGYNLKTLTRPRCPECGLDFDWTIVLDKAAWRSDFLFEHNWRNRPIQSWWRTVHQSFRPYRFWKQVSIHERIVPAPLWAMLGISVILFFVLFHSLAWLGSSLLGVADFLLSPRAGFGLRQGPLLESSTMLGDIAEAPFQGDPDYLMMPMAIVLLLLSSLLLLCSLRQTLGRCRVRSVQILRVVAYIATPVLFLWGVFFTALAALIPWLPSPDVDITGIIIGLAAYTIPPTMLAFYLGVGLKRYLRLPHAWFLCAVTTIVALLFTFTAIFVPTLMWSDR